MVSAGVGKKVKLGTTSLLKLKNFYICFSNIPLPAELVQPEEASDKIPPNCGRNFIKMKFKQTTRAYNHTFDCRS
jgi:hypothetical protein